MNAQNQRIQPAAMPVIWLACTSCQLVYQLDQSAFEAGATGCPRCGGWTWIAQLGTDQVGTDCVTTPCRRRVLSSSDPAVSPPRSPAGSGSPTTSR